MRTIIAALILLAIPAQALAQQMICRPTAELEGTLAKQYGELPFAGGLDTGTRPLAIYLNPETGTFTIAFRTPNKLSCIVAGGTDFTLIKKGLDL